MAAEGVSHCLERIFMNFLKMAKRFKNLALTLDLDL